MTDFTRLALESILTDRPVAYHPVLAKALGSINAGLFLSQLLYWQGKGRFGEWTYKTADEFYEELGMSRKQQEGARSILKTRGILQEKLKGVPPTLYFRVVFDELIAVMSGVNPDKDSLSGGEIKFYKRANLNSTKGPNQIRQKGQIITEITTKSYSKEEEENLLCRANSENNPMASGSKQPDIAAGENLQTEEGNIDQSQNHISVPNQKEKEAKKTSRTDTYREQRQEIISALNAALGSKYSPDSKGAQHINARLAEGASTAECIAVIEYKAEQWLKDPKLCGFLRPQTLFGAEKFEGYREEARRNGKIKRERDAEWEIIQEKKRQRMAEIEAEAERCRSPSGSSSAG